MRNSLQGITTYFSSNYEPNDIEQVNELMKQHNIEGYNNRTIKIQSETDGTPRYQVDFLFIKYICYNFSNQFKLFFSFIRLRI